ncbi:cytochrome P450 [Ganoderma leucocontextum]|nr:cytochrome P450 [Ganoderma leucocontextum]
MLIVPSSGDIIYFDVLRQPVITLNSLHHSVDLLDKKSANFSNRPDLVMAKLLGLDQYFVFTPYGKKWRQHRRAFHQTLGPEAIAQWQPTQLKSARRLLRRLLQSPEDFLAHLNMVITETGMRVAYGIELAGGESDREYFNMAQRAATIAEPLLHSSAQVMQVFPFLSRLPSWLPGLRVNREVAEKRREMEAVNAKLYTLATTATDNGVIRDSMVTRILADANAEDARMSEMQEMGQYVPATSFMGMYSNATMEAFFLAMAMHPEAQKKAQQELDAVVGPDRLPEFSDLDSLLYLRQILKETQRWHIITPLGLAHTSVADDVYDGYHIPAGAIINQNMWAMSRDERDYPDPESFLPERFLPAGDKPPARDPADYIFGFGRRICPGRHFAEASLLISCASILHVFNIRPPLDKHGLPVKLKYRATDDMISCVLRPSSPVIATSLRGCGARHVQGYEYVIEPRRPRAERLVGEGANNS